MLAWTALIDALVRVESTQYSDAGLLSFGDSADGGIFAENGRVCWAAARGMQRRLHDLLQACAAERNVDVDFNLVYQRCRATGVMLGETLVDEGLVTPMELETSLRRHSAESLMVLCDEEPGEPSWISRGAKGYEPRFTFRPIDVLFDVVSLSVPDLHAAARGELDRFAAEGRTGAAFLLDHDLAVPVGVFGDISVYDLWLLGRWAVALPMATRELGTTPSMIVAATEAGKHVAVWWRRELLYVVVCDDRRALSEVLHHLGDVP